YSVETWRDRESGAAAKPLGEPGHTALRHPALYTVFIRPPRRSEAVPAVGVGSRVFLLERSFSWESRGGSDSSRGHSVRRAPNSGATGSCRFWSISANASFRR